MRVQSSLTEAALVIRTSGTISHYKLETKKKCEQIGGGLCGGVIGYAVSTRLDTALTLEALRCGGINLIFEAPALLAAIIGRNRYSDRPAVRDEGT